jgi:predicted cobalt transporter CbtA
VGLPLPPTTPQPTQPANQLWWLPDVLVAAAGIGLVALGVLTKTDTDLLVTAGLTTVGAAVGHLTGKQSPVP